MPYTYCFEMVCVCVLSEGIGNVPTILGFVCQQMCIGLYSGRDICGGTNAPHTVQKEGIGMVGY